MKEADMSDEKETKEKETKEKIEIGSYLIVKPGQMPIFFREINEQEIRDFVKEGFEIYQRRN